MFLLKVVKRVGSLIICVWRLKMVCIVDVSLEELFVHLGVLI